MAARQSARLCSADNFALCDLQMPDSIETIGDAAFGYGLSLKSVTLPKSLKTMGTGVFYKCWKNLYKVIIPDEVQITKLPANTFESCQALTYLYLGQNITATSPVSLYDTNANLVVDTACAKTASAAANLTFIPMIWTIKRSLPNMKSPVKWTITAIQSIKFG